MGKPKQKDIVGWHQVREVCQKYLDYIDSDEYSKEDHHKYEQEVFEKAMETVFGEGVWDFVTQKIG